MMFKKVMLLTTPTNCNAIWVIVRSSLLPLEAQSALHSSSVSAVA